MFYCMQIKFQEKFKIKVDVHMWILKFWEKNWQHTYTVGGIIYELNHMDE